MAADKKVKLMENIVSRCDEITKKISSVQTQKEAELHAAKFQLEEKLSNASLRKEHVLKDVSQKSKINKERYHALL